ncbi:MAG: hypothetical protein ACJAYN_000784 [Bermanella sp.]|jgi:hypothetical protein
MEFDSKSAGSNFRGSSQSYEMMMTLYSKQGTLLLDSKTLWRLSVLAGIRKHTELNIDRDHWHDCMREPQTRLNDLSYIDVMLERGDEGLLVVRSDLMMRSMPQYL